MFKNQMSQETKLVDIVIGLNEVVELQQEQIGYLIEGIKNLEERLNQIYGSVALFEIDTGELGNKH